MVKRLETEAGTDEKARINRAYELLYARTPTKKEVKTARRFLSDSDSNWKQYAQMLLASTEFTTVR